MRIKGRSAVVLMALFGLVAVFAPTALAAPTTQQGEGVCVAHSVTLHGKQPASIRCMKRNTDGISPDTSEGSCDFGDSKMTLEIYSKITGDWCFFYEGYVGLGGTSSGPIYGVDYIESYNGAVGWVEYYQPPYSPGTGIQFQFGSNKFYGYPPFDGNQKITQVDVESYDCQLFC